jgi:HEAT repeat protein
MDALSSSVRATVNDAKLQSDIIMECTDEAITDASFDVILELLETNSLDDDLYRKLEARYAELVELFSEKSDLENILHLFNALKTQSLQGKCCDHASAMIRSVFSSEKVNTKVVETLRKYGRKQRDSAYKLTTALQAFIIPYLLNALSEESNTSTRRFLMSLLTSVRNEAIDHIAKRLHGSSWYVLRNMLYLLRECKGRRYKKAVRGFLEHELPLIRLEALRTLLSFQDSEADPYVIKFLNSNVLQLQKGTVRLTGAYRIKKAVPHLIRLLNKKDIRGKSFPFKRGIVRALGRIGDSRAVSHLLNICRAEGGIYKDELDKLKVEIFRTLNNYPATTVGPLLEYGMKSANKEILDISKKLMKRYGLSTVKQG